MGGSLGTTHVLNSIIRLQPRGVLTPQTFARKYLNIDLLAGLSGGNLTSDSGSGGSKADTYNKRNRLSNATLGALVYNYTYNALEQLAIRAQVTPSATTHFIHDRLGNVIAETAGGGPTGTTLFEATRVGFVSLSEKFT